MTALEQSLLLYLPDHSLACRLERAEAAANARFVEAHARLDPASRRGEDWCDVRWRPLAVHTNIWARTLAVAYSSRVGQIGGGVLQRPGGSVCYQVSPMADKAILPILNERGYRRLQLRGDP